MRIGKICILTMILVIGITCRSEAFILINEILADPPQGIAGDANNDGKTSSSQDEFIELYNDGSDAVNLSGWSLEDALKLRHEFPSGSLMNPNAIWVVFGGGSPDLPGIHWQIASTGTLSLNNSSDTVILKDQKGHVIDRIEYGKEAGQDQSLSRSPEGEDTALIQHSLLPGAEGQPYSAGYFVNSDQVIPDEPENPEVPEPMSLFLLGLGLTLLMPLGKSRIIRRVLM